MVNLIDCRVRRTNHRQLYKLGVCLLSLAFTRPIPIWIQRPTVNRTRHRILIGVLWERAQSFCTVIASGTGLAELVIRCRFISASSHEIRTRNTLGTQMNRLISLFIACSFGASAQITWTKVWPPINNGTHNPPNGYEDILWDSAGKKVWIYSTNGTNSGDQIYSIRLHYFDPVALTDTNIGDNGQTQGGGCFVSSATWPYTHHAMGQFWIDQFRGKLYTVEGVGCTEQVLEEWSFPIAAPVSGRAWTEVFSPGLATNHPGENGAYYVFGTTTLSAAMAAGDASMSLTNAGYGVQGDFYLIDSEIVRIKSNGNPYLMGQSPVGTGSNPFGIARAQYGTPSQTHASGATVYRLNGQFNNGKVVHDTYHDAFFWLAQSAFGWGYLYVKCDSSGTGTLTQLQQSVGCTRPDDWVDITSKSICSDSTACTASKETGSNGSNSGKLPRGTYYPSLDYLDSSHQLITFAGGSYQVQYQYSLIYDPSTFTWTRLANTCNGAHCTGLLALNVTAGGSGYTSVPTVTINGCTGATAAATLSGGVVRSLTITEMGTACSSPTVTLAGGGGSGATATATANTLNAPPIWSYNSENTRIAHAVFNGKYYYHLSQHPGGYTGVIQDWVLDPVAHTWTELQDGKGPSYTEAMTVDPATGNLYAWVVPTVGSDAEIWQGQIGETSVAPSITTLALIPSGTVSAAYSLAFAATGTAPITWTVVSGSLPPGLNLSSNGVLSGTPTSAGSYTFAVSASNSIGTAPQQSFSVTIAASGISSPPSDSAAPPVISSSSPLPPATQGSPYTYSFAATGTTPITWSATGMPSGFSMSSTGVLSGTASAQGGPFTIVVSAGNSAGAISSNFLLTVGSPPLMNTQGLGHSTYNCIDVDGDGYGVGPGCLGPDADDTDAGVHSASDVLAKWGTFAAFWTHLGWNPGGVLYVDGGTGSCTRTASPFVYNAATACPSVDAAIAAMSAGDAVVVRGGTYTRAANTAIYIKSGTLSGSTCTATSYFLAYPGELPDFEWTGYSSGVGFSSGTQSCYTVDGWKVHGYCTSANSGLCVGRGIANSGPGNGAPVYGATISHIDVGNFTDNVFPQFYQIGTQIIHNYIHDAIPGADFGHDIYLGSDCPGSGAGLAACSAGTSNGSVIRGNIIANAGDTCIHANGPMTNITVDSNLIYGCDKAINLQSGVSHSLFQNNVTHTTGVAFQLNTYATGYGPPNNELWQCHDLNYNVIRNNTFFMDAQSFNSNVTGTIDAGAAAIYATDGGGSDTGGCLAGRGVMPDLGHNTYENNIVVHDCGTNCYDYKGPILRYYSPAMPSAAMGWLQSDTFRNNVFKNFDTNTRIVDAVGSSTVFQTCSWFTNPANVPLASGNVCDVDPQFIAANPQWSTTPANWNLRVPSSSPASGAAFASDAAAYDITGAARPATPTIGAYDSQGTAGQSASACDLNADGVVNSADVQIAIAQALGTASCTNADLIGNQSCSVVDVQRIIDASAGGSCRTGQ